VKDSQEGIQVLHLKEKGKRIKSLRSESQKSSEEIALCVQRLCRSAEVTESFEGFKRKFPKLRRSSIFICAGETQVEELTEERRTKVEAFEHLEFFQVREESAKAQEEHNCRRIQPKRSGPLKISRPGSSGRAHAEPKRF
jgi:hypothetical protein